MSFLFAHSSIEYKYLKQIYLTLTGTITLDESGTRSNDNEGLLNSPTISRTEASTSDTY